MHVTVVYALSYASAMGFLVIWRLSQYFSLQAREHIYSFYSKWVLYSVVYPRYNGSNDVTIMASCIILVFVVANVVGSVLGVQSRADLSTRLARMCVTNIVVLFFGGRSNFLVDRIFRLSSADYYLLHRWIGRITLLEGLTHGTLCVIKTKARTQAIEISLYILLGIMALLSLLQVRRRIYELFVRSHLPNSIGILTLLCFHAKPLSTYILICLVVSVSLLLLQKLSWLIFFMYRNFGVGPACRASIIRFTQSTPGKDVLQVRIDLKKPWNLAPGQFIYLSLPALRILRLGVLESHPFMVAWPINDEREKLRSIVLLIQAHRGFTRKLQLADYKVSALIDGPYGDSETQALEKYDKILLMSSGIGLAAHLSTTRHLLLAHNQQTARVRRLTLVWLLETQDQMRWAEEFLCALDDMDSRHILTIFLFYPSDAEGAAEGHRTVFTSPRKRILAVPDTLDMTWLIESEWGAEAGNMLVTVCGSPHFELCVRKTVRSSPHSIDFRNCAFQPDETELSEFSSSRYSMARSKA